MQLVPNEAPPVSASVPTLIMNAHQMTTRSKNGIRKPKFKVLTAIVNSSLEPKFVKEALSISHWKQTMDEEYVALMRNQTWSLVKLPQDRVAIGTKWVFRVKYHPDGSI